MNGILRLSGRYIVKAWKRGELERWMGRGASLAEATAEACKRNLLRDVRVAENLITTAGLYLAGDLLIDTGAVGLTYFAIGTSDTAPNAADTTLTTEVKRMAISSRSRAAAVVTLSTFMVAANCTYAIEEVGIFGDAASATPDSGTLFSHALLEEDNSAGANDLTFDYELTVSDATT